MSVLQKRKGARVNAGKMYGSYKTVVLNDFALATEESDTDIDLAHLEGGQVLDRIRTWTVMSHSP